MHTCVCCQREIAEGELCSDCEAELRTFIEFSATHPVRVVDIMAEFDLDDTQTMELLRTIRPPRAVESLASRLETDAEYDTEAQWYMESLRPGYHEDEPSIPRDE